MKARMNMQSKKIYIIEKFEVYMEKKGIKLTFLIPK